MQAASPSRAGGFFDEPEKHRIVTISGANKDIGKSSLAAYLASHCRNCAGVKISMHEGRIAGEALIEELEAGQATDTARILAAGAKPVFWLRTTPQHLLEDLKRAIGRIEAPVIIIEGNTVLEYVDPDYAVFIMGPGFEDFKPSANMAIAKADTVVINGDGELGGERLMELEREIKRINPKSKLLVVSELGKEKTWEIVLSRAAGRVGGEFMTAEVSEKVLEAVKAGAKDGRITCAAALKLAEELGVSPQEVGRAANALNIKIANCSLGCF